MVVGMVTVCGNELTVGVVGMVTVGGGVMVVGMVTVGGNELAVGVDSGGIAVEVDLEKHAALNPWRLTVPSVDKDTVRLLVVLLTTGLSGLPDRVARIEEGQQNCPSHTVTTS